MEKQIKIRVSAKYFVYGKLDGSFRQPLFIMVHGLATSKELGLYQEAVRWFRKQGFATFRFDLYGWQKDARQLINCTLKTHADDLDAVVRYFRKRGVKKIFVAGHSYGGPAIFLSREQDFDGAALLDPSYRSSFTKKRYGLLGGRYIKQLKGYLMQWGTNAVIGKKMADEADLLAWNDLPKNFHVPLIIIAAGEGVLVKGAKLYFKTAHNPKSLAIIKGATHCFDDSEKIQESVFRLSKHWFGKRHTENRETI